MSLYGAGQTEVEEATIVIVANRGPHDFVWEEGRWVAKSTAGGIVSMIEPLARQPNVAWFCCVSEPPGSEMERAGLFTLAHDQTDPLLNVVPVPLPANIYQDFYGEISNEVLWMLQHHLVGQFGCRPLDQRRHEAWDNYLEANRRVVEAIRATEIPVRAFLIQDYHLYGTAQMLRQRFPQTPSLHFIHIPFPEPSLLKLIPRSWREAILRGLLGADVIGLQTKADVRCLLACCQEILGADVDWEHHAITLRSGRRVRACSFPASIDPDAIHCLQGSERVLAARQRLQPELRELNIIRVDRMDPSKNQILGFTAFERLLELHPELRGRVRFLAFLVPSRTDLTVYRGYHDAVYREIERVNARYTESCGFEPVKVFYTNDRAQAFAAMEVCDVLLVNSRQDGMNLVVKEWAELSTRPGVLVLSETTGVAEEMAGFMLPVCPLDIEGTAKALADALAMPHPQRRFWLEKIRSGIRRWTARDWLVAQLHELGITLPEAAPPTEAPPPARQQPRLAECELEVLNHEGIHARPAAAFVRCARGFESDIVILRGNHSFPAKSILSVLSANLNRGTLFTLRAEGPDAAEAVERIRQLLESFHLESV